MNENNSLVSTCFVMNLSFVFAPARRPIPRPTKSSAKNVVPRIFAVFKTTNLPILENNL